jgi:4,5-DOPA dioxygenase extradiol
MFVGHGAPTLAIEPGPAHSFFMEIGRQIERPRAIVCVSAHWERHIPAVSATEQPQTIYDFYGFPDALYRMHYAAPGAPEIAERVGELLEAAAFPCQRDRTRGLDHGAWIPLTLMYPQADIPTLQLTVMHDATPARHYALGQALAPLRDEGVLILGSGNATHNLREFGAYAGQPDAMPPTWVTAFDAWLTDAVLRNKQQALFDYRQRAPHAVRNHPTEEHLLPLFVAMGAGGDEANATILHHSFSYGILSMSSFAFT